MHDKIVLVNLQKQYATIKSEIDPAIQKVLNDCDFIQGQAVKDFETAFADYCETRYCAGVSNGTDALYMALVAAGIKPGDEVITQANTYIATVLAISRVGAKPILVDADPHTYQIDPVLIEKALSTRTKAIVPVHLYGHMAPMDDITRIASKYGLRVIEDAAQAHGATYKGKRAGTFGDMACYSFYPGKNLGGYGDGGAIVANKEAYDAKLRKLRNYGEEKKYVHVEKGFNFRLDTLQAAVLNVKLKHIDNWNAARRKHAALYTKLLSQIPGIQLPKEDPNQSSVYHLYVIQVDKRDELLEFLKRKNIYCGIHYPIPVHMQGAYSDLKLPKGMYKVTEAAADRIISLPMYAELTQKEIEYVVDCIKEFINGTNKS